MRIYPYIITGTTTHRKREALKYTLFSVGSTNASTSVVIYNAIKSTAPIIAKILLDDFISILLNNIVVIRAEPQNLLFIIP